MILRIVKFGNPILSKKADEVTEFDDELRDLISDMFETMYAERGAGLAAPQVGISKRIFVMDCSVEGVGRKFALINPFVTTEHGAQAGPEGCLSVPAFEFDIERPQRLSVQGNDINGGQVLLECEDFEARCVSHEIDHLDGRLLLSRLSSLKRDLTERKIRRLIRQGKW